MVVLDYKSPQARYQAQQDVQNTLVWLDSVRALGPEALAAVDQAAAARWLGRTLGVPGELIREPDAIPAEPDLSLASSLAIDAAADRGGPVIGAARPALIRAE